MSGVVRDILEAEAVVKCLKGALTRTGICCEDLTLEQKDDLRRVIGRLLDDVWRKDSPVQVRPTGDTPTGEQGESDGD